MKKLNLGCGQDWKFLYPDYEGLDTRNHGQKYHGDVIQILLNRKEGLVDNLDYGIFLEDETYDEVMANHFLEHFDVDDLKHIFLGVHRILKSGGLFRITVPHKDRPEAWYLTHRTFWNEATFEMFGRVDTDDHVNFGKWEVEEVITNGRKNIHALLKKL